MRFPLRFPEPSKKMSTLPKGANIFILVKIPFQKESRKILTELCLLKAYLFPKGNIFPFSVDSFSEGAKTL